MEGTCMTDSATRKWPRQQGNDDWQHDESPSETDALAHTDIDWNDTEQDRAETRDEARQERARRLDEAEDDHLPNGSRYRGADDR